MSDTPVPVAVGNVVKAYGKYFLVRKLAEGGMAEIFLAKQQGVEGFEKNVVIKRMLPHLSGVADFVSMFLDEARLAASLAHPNVVQISDLGFADGCYFICMEYLPGEDFATVVRTARRRNEQAPLKVTLRVITEAAVGLHFAHEAVDQTGAPMNLVHRDVSPSNIFITYSGQVKVLDFGIAKAESRIANTTAGVVKGKYQYMSPEQAAGDPVDRRSDVYSLGVSLYEALTGVRPFARDSDLAILKAVLSGEHAPILSVRPDLPPEVVAIVERAMAHDRETRYPTALALAQDIETFIGGTTSASGGQTLSTFMAAFFGPERMRSKTRIESLDELAKRGVDVPGHVNPHSPKTDAGFDVTVQPAQERTNAIGAPLTVRAQRTKRTALYVGLGLAAVAGIVGTYFATRPAVVVPPPSVVQPPVVVVDAGPVPVVEIDAGLVVDAGQPEEIDAGVAVVPVKPVQLSIAMVQKLLTQNKPRFQQCFRANKAELPTPQGTLTVNFAIAGSGKVTSVATSMEGTKVSACISKAVAAIKFPKNTDREVRVPLPMSWDVR